MLEASISDDSVNIRYNGNISFWGYSCTPLYLSGYATVGNRPHNPLTFFHSPFIIKLIYKSRTHIPLSFFTNFPLYFLKLVSNSTETPKVGRRGCIRNYSTKASGPTKFSIQWTPNSFKSLSDWFHNLSPFWNRQKLTVIYYENNLTTIRVTSNIDSW